MFGAGLFFTLSTESAEAEETTKMSDSKEPKVVMCQWFAGGKTEYMCLKKPMKEAQKTCNEQASKQRGDDSKCSCTDDENYIRDTCN